MNLLLSLLIPDPPHPILHARRVTFWTKDDAVPVAVKRGTKTRAASGERGVFLDKSRNKYYVNVNFQGLKHSRSSIATIEEAVRIRDELEKEIGKT